MGQWYQCRVHGECFTSHVRVRWSKTLKYATMSDHEDEHTIAEDLVVTKYKMAGEIVNRVLKTCLTKCIDGASVQEICAEGDRLLNEETGKVFKKRKRYEEGYCFPSMYKCEQLHQSLFTPQIRR